MRYEVANCTRRQGLYDICAVWGSRYLIQVHDTENDDALTIIMQAEKVHIGRQSFGLDQP